MISKSRMTILGQIGSGFGASVGDIVVVEFGRSSIKLLDVEFSPEAKSMLMLLSVLFPSVSDTSEKFSKFVSTTV